jgi:hypothetical protein
MKVSYHPEFAQDVLRFAGEYGAISPKLEIRFRMEVDDALVRIKAEPTASGHFLNTGSAIVTDVRRRNLVSFPCFVLYGLHADLMVFGAVIPSASDPLTWLDRFSKPAS